ncbi:uncharacterized protein C3orf38 homolog [Ischnura elegans]|uniref:uncharacterized protein C3orf38 homolog n=1 Tax=Ischnura elegans TaxID=197161 RepID=UPI001ED8879B|nr:uncharacterized protein C3orf38 homolog [Ischnura elegans]
MLSSQQQAFIEDLLNNMRVQDLVSLANTVTANMVSLTSVEEAKKCILLHTDTLSSLLRRKKITKELLFNYLHGKNVSVCPTLDKHQLIEVTLQYWDSLHYPSEVTGYGEKNSGGDSVQISGSDSEVILMSLKFVQWFYNMLNQATDGFGEVHFGVEHFWPDCSMKLQLISQTHDSQEEVQGDSNEVVRLFLDMKSRYNVYFHPNVSRNGVHGKKDPHGLVLVLSCGTLHKHDVCCGVFEQMFGLIEDPSTNNWKIKFTELKLKNSDNVYHPPSISDTQLFRLMEN